MPQANLENCFYDIQIDKLWNSVNRHYSHGLHISSQGGMKHLNSLTRTKMDTSIQMSWFICWGSWSKTLQMLRSRPSLRSWMKTVRIPGWMLSRDHPWIPCEHFDLLLECERIRENAITELFLKCPSKLIFHSSPPPAVPLQCYVLLIRHKEYMCIHRA